MTAAHAVATTHAMATASAAVTGSGRLPGARNEQTQDHQRADHQVPESTLFHTSCSLAHEPASPGWDRNRAVSGIARRERRSPDTSRGQSTAALRGGPPGATRIIDRS